MKNIIILGAARSGKTTLARRLQKEYHYNLVSLDDIICAFESLPECGIHHDGNDTEVSKKFAPFLIRYLKELSEGPNFYNGITSVIEGTHIDFEQLIPYLENEGKDKYKVIGLTYNEITKEELYQTIRKYDTEDDWTYWCNDEELKGDVEYFINRNRFFHKQFMKYNIEEFDTSFDRDKVLDQVIDSIKKSEKKR